jgi:two-component system sensor histidine kinase PilS (NtrC family)
MLAPPRLLRWMYIGRLSVATAIFLAAVAQWREADAGSTLVAAMGLFTAIAFTAGSVWRSGGRPRVGVPFLAAQAVFDLLLVTAVIHVTGGAASQFAALYILVIAGSAIMLPTAGGLVLAALGSALYCAGAIGGREGVIGLGIILQLLVFAFVALSIAYISARLREAGAGREELEAQLAMARLQADDILRNIGSGILTVDASGRLLYINATACRLLAVGADTVIGKPVAQTLGGVAPGLAEALERAVRDRVRVNRGEASITTPARTFPIGLTTTTIETGRDPSGVSATAIFQDITDNKRLEELRLRAERLEGVTELSASLAHEIKNPLASIRSAVEQLATAPRATEDDRVLGGLIVRESDRLSRLLSEFLDFARVRVTRVERVDLGAIARAAANLAAAHPECRRGVRVDCVAPREPLLVEGDEDLLHRAVFNIALNAVQAVPDEHGVVRIEVARLRADQVPRVAPFVQGAVALRVADNGPGIPADLRDRVFDPFFTTKAGGTGLGLPIVHRAIDAHRGAVFVDTGAQGTTFTILLPHSPAAAGAAA